MGTLAKQEQEQREERPGGATGTRLPHMLESSVVCEKAPRPPHSSPGPTGTAGLPRQVCGHPLAPFSSCEVRRSDLP